MAGSIKQLLMGIVLCLSDVQIFGMDCDKEIAERAEKLVYFAQRGEEVASQFEIELQSGGEESELAHEFDHTEVLKEILAVLKKKTKIPSSYDDGLAYLKCYVDSFITTIPESRFDDLLTRCVRKSSLLKNPLRIRAEWRMKRYKNFATALYGLSSDASVCKLRDVTRDKIQKDRACELTKLSSLLAYYFEFGQKYAREYLSSLLTGMAPERTDAVLKTREEYKISCGLLFRILKSLSPREPAQLEAWACMNALSKGVLDVIQFTSLEEHLKDIEQKMKETLDKNVDFYGFTLRMFDEMAVSSPSDSKEMLKRYLK